MTTSDEALARAASEGDRDAFGTLLQRHYDRVFRLAFRLTGRREAAEDLTQDICAALPDKLAGWRGEARFTTWLYRVVVNAAEDARRRAATHARAASRWGETEVLRRDEARQTQDALTWLNAAMAALPSDLRATVALTVEDDMTQAEAARILGISEGTVAWRMSQAKKALRAMTEAET